MNLFVKKRNEEKKTEKFSFCTFQKVEYVDKQCIIMGTVEGHIQFHDELYVLGPKGFHCQIKISQLIEIDKNNHVYGLIIDREAAGMIEKGYIFTNHYDGTAKDVDELDNYYLHYLLEEVNSGNDQILDELLEEIAIHCHFISLFDEKEIPFCMIDEKKYYPLFSCCEEVQKYNSTINKNYIFSLSNYISIIENHDDISGIVINPENKKRNIVLNKEILHYIEKTKDKNMEDYLKLKDIHYRMRW